ncbi:MAG TPA: isoprenylcysteine carboxylmethyltransferase family protein [Casimicrobiaceae bacterium]|nr:isoprenylcysteine carboxylmethyltransferase family protein [Casimicrobiaceae bacterium]
MFKRSIVFLYGLLSYLLFLATFLYAIGFVGNVVVPRSIDSPREGDFAGALAVDVALLLLFAVQHSGMARRGFKRFLTRFIPEAAERSTYVLCASLALIVMFAFWRPLGGTVWTVQQPVAVASLYALSAFGWVLVLIATFLINHFDLFGLRQVSLYLVSAEYRSIDFRTPGPYRLIRHPLYAGFLFAFWGTPTMTMTHLLFAVATTGYILIAIQLEERDLIANLGDAYRAYRRRVPMLIPFTGAAGDRGAPGRRMSI